MKYISLLRGINVSGQKKIKMTDLKYLYERLGFQDVATYIQSGNVIFKAENHTDLNQRIEKAIQKQYSFHVPVEIRTSREMSSIIKNCPFGSRNSDEDGTKILITFLSAEPSQENLATLRPHVIDPEKLLLKGKEIYLYCPNGYGKSKLSNTFLEQKLKVGATTRNWKTVNKLHELSMD